MIRSYYFIILSLVAFSCRKGDNVPAYLEIPRVTVAEGSDTISSKITDVWVYADEELLGVWELPARIPVLKEGDTRIQLETAVKRNGMFDDRARYPFYLTYDGNVALSKTASTVLKPQIGYIGNVEVWSEGFEDAGFQLLVTEESDTTLDRITDPAVLLDGTAVGTFSLDQQHPYLRAYTDEDFSANGGPVFLELDYSTNVILTIGVLYTSNGVSTGAPFVYLVPTAGGDGSVPVWNKVYIDLSPVYNSNITQRDIFFEAWAPAGGVARVYLDNVKLVRITS
jgi:uncharacterized small protein (DUF1192 family)